MREFDGLAADLPEQPLAVGAILQVQVSEVEERLQLLAVLQRIVIVLAEVLLVDVLVQVHHFENHFGVDLRQVDFGPAQARIQRPDDVGDEDGMVGGHGAAALGHDRGRRHVFRFADFVDGVDDIVGVLLDAVVHAAIRRRAAAVVVDAEPAADVEILDRITHLVDFGVDARGFLDRALDPADVGDLGADVEVQHLELARHLQIGGRFEAIQQLDGVDAELGGFAAGFLPFPRPAGENPHPDPQSGLGLQRRGNFRDLLEIRDLLHDDDRILADFGRPAWPIPDSADP